MPQASGGLALLSALLLLFMPTANAGGGSTDGDGGDHATSSIFDIGGLTSDTRQINRTFLVMIVVTVLLELFMHGVLRWSPPYARLLIIELQKELMLLGLVAFIVVSIEGVWKSAGVQCITLSTILTLSHLRPFPLLSVMCRLPIGVWQCHRVYCNQPNPPPPKFSKSWWHQLCPNLHPNVQRTLLQPARPSLSLMGKMCSVGSQEEVLHCPCSEEGVTKKLMEGCSALRFLLVCTMCLTP